MPSQKLPGIALVWTQFIPTHVDRILATARRLDGKVQLSAIEVASTSQTYGSFETTGPIAGIERHTLFPGHSYDEISPWRRFWALLFKLVGKKVVCIGIPYSALETLALTLILRLLGTSVYLVYDSKFDDKPRSAWFEAIKRLGLGCYSGAIVAGARTNEYLRFLGFNKRPILGGADGISVERIREQARAGQGLAPRQFTERDFVYVGRFVEVKNLELLIDAYADYESRAKDKARRLILVGEGPLEPALRQKVANLGLGEKVQFPGFKSGEVLCALLCCAVALVLVSGTEPWGLVVNEALALGLPIVVSEAPGARDVLVRNLVNGLVVENGSREGLARAMAMMTADEATWQAMSAASTARAWLGDSERFADAAELIVDPAAQPAGAHMAQYLATFEEALGNQRSRQFSL